MNEDLQDLVDNPKETLEVEVKAHLDLANDKVHRAKLARHLGALARWRAAPGVMEKDFEAVFHSVDKRALRVHGCG